MASEKDCQLMAEIAESTLLRTVLTFTTFCCLLCLPSCFYSLWRIQKSVKLHFNSKCVIFTHNSSMLLHCIARIILHGKDLINYFGPWISGCEIFPSRDRCELRLVYKLTQYVMEISPFILTAERFVATFQSHKYENRCKFCGLLLLLIHLSLSFLMLFIQKSGNFGDQIIFYCWLASTGNRYMLNMPIFIILFAQVVTIPGLLYVLRKNEKYRETSLQQCATLSQRYQIFENLRTLNMFRIMSVVTWAFVTYNAAASYGVVIFLPSLPMAHQFASLEVTHCLPVYFLLLTYLILREDKKPRSQFVIKINHYQPHYFNDLQKFFDDAFDKIHLRKHGARTAPAPMTTI